MNKIHDKKYASQHEVECALRNLTDEDIYRLEKAALFLVGNNSITNPRKILRETIKSALSGDRHWCTEVKFMTFLQQALRSNADNYHKKQRRMYRLLKAGNVGDEGKSPEEKLLMYEHEVLVKKRYDEVWKIFKDDNVVESIFLGREEEMKPQEIMDTFDISKTEYNSALRRIRRKISKKFPDGWQTW